VPELRWGCLIVVAAGVAIAGCDPMIITVEQDGKSVPRSVYEYGPAWPFSRDVEPAPPPESVRRELLAIAPLGTPRAEALRKLNAAGIKLDRAIRAAGAGHEQPMPDLFVGSFWNRPQGKIWIVDIDLEFDASHRLRRIDVALAPRAGGGQPLEAFDSTKMRQSIGTTATVASPQSQGPAQSASDRNGAVTQ